MPGDLAPQVGGILPVQAGAREGGGEDKPVPGGQVEIADIGQPATLGPVTLAEAPDGRRVLRPADDLVPVGEVKHEVGGRRRAPLVEDGTRGGALRDALADDGGGEVGKLHHAVEIVQVPLHVGEDEAQVVRLQRETVLQPLVGHHHPLAHPVMHPLDAFENVQELGVGLRRIVEDGHEVVQLAGMQPVVTEAQGRETDDLQSLAHVHSVFLISRRDVPEREIAHILERAEHGRFIRFPQAAPEGGDSLSELARRDGGVEVVRVGPAREGRLEPRREIGAEALGPAEAPDLGRQNAQVMVVDPTVPSLHPLGGQST